MGGFDGVPCGCCLAMRVRYMCMPIRFAFGGNSAKFGFPPHSRVVPISVYFDSLTCPATLRPPNIQGF